MDSTNFIMLNIVPKSEAIESVKILGSEINIKWSQTFGVLFSIIGIAIAVSVAFGLLIANRIITPVKQLTNSVAKLTHEDALVAVVKSKNDIQINSILEAQDDEIGDLTRAFKGMIESIRTDVNNNI